MLEIKNEEQRKHIKSILKKTSIWFPEDESSGLNIDDWISFDTMAEIVDYLRTSDRKSELFEKCWVAYRRKGSKKKAKEYWDKLEDVQKPLVLPHIKVYVQTRELSYQRDFERYLRDKIFLTIIPKGNKVLYDPNKFDSLSYSPQGRSIWFDEKTNSYWSDDNFYYGTISDGYTDDNRPDCATLTLNNSRGIITWNSLTKKWEKK